LVKGVPEQPTLVFIPLFCSWHKIKCHICPSHCSFYGIADFGKAWQQKNHLATLANIASLNRFQEEVPQSGAVALNGDPTYIILYLCPRKKNFA
jgi:hypothetical protein